MQPISQKDRSEITRIFDRVASLNPTPPSKLLVEAHVSAFIFRSENRLRMKQFTKTVRPSATARQALGQIQRFKAVLKKFDKAYSELSRPAFDAIANILDEERHKDWGPFDMNDLLYLHPYYVHILLDALEKAEGTVEVGAPERGAPRKEAAHQIVENLAEIYERLSGKKPGITVSTDTSTTEASGVAGGAFLDMIKVAFRAFGINANPKAMYDSYVSAKRLNRRKVESFIKT